MSRPVLSVLGLVTLWSWFPTFGSWSGFGLGLALLGHDYNTGVGFESQSWHLCTGARHLTIIVFSSTRGKLVRGRAGFCKWNSSVLNVLDNTGTEDEKSTLFIPNDYFCDYTLNNNFACILKIILVHILQFCVNHHTIFVCGDNMNIDWVVKANICSDFL